MEQKKKYGRGGKRENQTGRPTLYGEPTERRSIPLSLLPVIDKMLTEAARKAKG